LDGGLAVRASIGVAINPVTESRDVFISEGDREKLMGRTGGEGVWSGEGVRLGVVSAAYQGASAGGVLGEMRREC
jgi:outer membrane lipoprotein SlyB